MFPNKQACGDEEELFIFFCHPFLQDRSFDRLRHNLTTSPPAFAVSDQNIKVWRLFGRPSCV